MAIQDTLRKLFAPSREELIEKYDQWGEPIKKRETIDEMRLRKYQEREHRDKVRKLLKKYDEQHIRNTSPFDAYRKKYPPMKKY